MSYFTSNFIEFFKELSKNNHKEWFDQNRKRYEEHVKKPFHAFVDEMIRRINEDDPSVQILPKDAIFRINRDIRFSKDKSPYKTNVSALISAGGKKDKTFPGIYLELSAEGMRIYGGAHMLDKEQLNNVRETIAENPEGFIAVINDRQFKDKFGGIRGEKNKRVPKEFAEAAEKQPFILNKEFYYFVKLPVKTITSPGLADVTMEYYYAGKPVNHFLKKAMGN